MATSEPRVWIPKLSEPVIIERNLVFVQGKDRAREIEGNKRFLENVALEVLVNGALYLVIRDGHGLRAGNVLSRNLRMTQKGGGDRDDPTTHHFIRFDGVNSARRALGRLQESYKRQERPSLQSWRRDLDWMMRTSWTLHRADEADEAMFVWRAEQIAKKHGRVKDDEKVSASTRTHKAGTRRDKTDRVNTGMIPLLCSAANRSLIRRTQAIRGIGRRMDFRAVVLEEYIDQLRESCKHIRNAAQQRLSSAHVFGDKRTRGTVQEAAERMRGYSQYLDQIHARPFSRAFTHVSADLRHAASAMNHAAQTLDAKRMEVAAAVLKKIYRSMLILEYHWRLEEVLVVISDYHHRKSEISGPELELQLEELTLVHAELVTPDPFTKQELEYGFRNSILPRVVSSVKLARLTLEHGVEDGSATTEAYRHLKEACAPF